MEQFIKYKKIFKQQGYRKDPLTYKGKNLYFRGHKNSVAMFNYFKENLKLLSMKTVLLSGGSAGKFFFI